MLAKDLCNRQLAEMRLAIIGRKGIGNLFNLEVKRSQTGLSIGYPIWLHIYEELWKSSVCLQGLLYPVCPYIPVILRQKEKTINKGNSKKVI